jgi:tetratricopeptide (TPR) repeat protein
MLHYNRARWLTNLDRRPDEALTSYEHTIALLPDYARAHHGRGLALRNVGRMEEALAAHERAVELDPDNAIFQFGKGWQLLQLGDYANGFPLFEWRFRGGVRAKFREFRQPQWRGETAARQTLLLYAELGLGDNTQFVRYLPLAKARVGHVVLELPRTLWPLLGAMADGITLVEPGAALPEFDLHCVFMSLPYALGTTLNSVPAQVPYLTAPVERLPAWRARLPKTARVRVGLVWASSSTHYVAAKRNVQLTSLAPLLATEGVDFVSLQVQYRADDLPLLAQLPIERIDGAITDFGDTAAAIEQCDLVISVDTSVAHLAGALGKPVWVLLPFIADWRWLWNRNDSPWYPTARLFRPSRRDDWEDVIAKVARELAALF